MTVLAPQPVSLTWRAPRPGEQFYNAAGTYNWVVPQGVYNVRVTLIGGGGGAGSYGSWTTGSTQDGNPISSSAGGGGGGGAGALVQKTVPVSVGDTISVIVGAGGVPVDYVHLTWGKNTDGNAGQASSFGASISASGGQGGGGAYAQYRVSAPNTGKGGIGGVGAIASGGDLNTSGQNGNDGAHHSTVGLSYIHADGGAGGSGHLFRRDTYGTGGAGYPKTTAPEAQEPGIGGCCLIEWGV
ncbi:glycine-rich domain-containing protein [Kiloniella majae]|uniref:glycine-rich domain-containing protein n=1 Tax=Kiloniella majae TaxID=1938558 RepID=UPI000A279575|nr:hypothetical protein [Kiloniella majae]